jgi:hypothetical protein
MRFYGDYHDPNTHLQLTRQRENEVLRAAKRRDIGRGLLLVRLRGFLRCAPHRRPVREDVTIPSADVTRTRSSLGHRG